MGLAERSCRCAQTLAMSCHLYRGFLGEDARATRLGDVVHAPVRGPSWVDWAYGLSVGSKGNPGLSSAGQGLEILSIIRGGFTQSECGSSTRKSTLRCKPACPSVKELMEFGGRAGGELLGQLHEDFFPRQAATVDQPVGFFELVHVFVLVAGAAEADQVEPDHHGGGAIDGDEGGNVLHHVGLSADHGQAAYAAELVDADLPRDVGPVFHDDVAGESGAIGDDDVIADMAIVGEVHADHDEVVAADGGSSVGLHAAVDGHVLSDDVFGADDQLAAGSAVAGMLRHSAEHGAFIDVISRPELRPRFNDDVAGELAFISDLYASLDNAKRTDGDIVSEYCVGADHSHWMDFRHQEFPEK